MLHSKKMIKKEWRLRFLWIGWELWMYGFVWICITFGCQVDVGIAEAVAAFWDRVLGPSCGVSRRKCATPSGVTCIIGGLAGADALTWNFRPFCFTCDLCRPYVVLKIATSLDGRVACEDKTSQWITQAEARKDAHGLRADSQAILVGEGLGFRKS